MSRSIAPAPACMDADELAAWQEANVRMRRELAPSPCADCLPGFAADMRAAGRCNGTPGPRPGHPPADEAPVDELVWAEPVRSFSEAEIRGHVPAPDLRGGRRQVRIEPCACGTRVMAEADMATWTEAVGRHNRGGPHRLWWLRARCDWQGDEEGAPT